MTDPSPQPRLESHSTDPPNVATGVVDRFRIALIGDLHVYKLLIAPWHLLSKRLLGQTNLYLRRQARFQLARIDPLVQRIATLSPDALLCTGDITTTALPAEFDFVKRSLKPLTDRIPTYIAPGNHDRYTFSAARRRRFEIQLGQLTADAWPWSVSLQPNIQLIATDPARPRFVHAGGELGQPQRKKIAALLADNHPGWTILMCHYPIGTPHGAKPETHSHRLLDQPELISTLRDSNRPILYLHGHVHRPWCFRPANAPNVIVLNAGAPIMSSPDYPHGQGFWQIDLQNAPASRGVLTLTHHACSAAGHWQSRAIDVPDHPGHVTLA
ncbi:MAG: hypothetical protein CMJ49_14400 [Planctomycetaceae bacterium]|nr:hypothetical protein [Planctomycetaceae bacterium]